MSILFLIMFLCTYSYILGLHNCSTNEDDLEELWIQYKAKYNKEYKGFIEERRKAAFMNNYKAICKHNTEASQGKHGFFIGDNDLTDMSTKLYQRTMATLTPSRRRDPSSEIVGAINVEDETVPKEIDWRVEGFTTPPYNQKDCGSCYAFSITHVLQAQVYKQTNISVPLSVQQLVDCSMDKGNYGCGGGSLRNTLKYLDQSGGVMTEKDYPYVAKTSKCKFDKNKVMVNVSSWAILPPHDEQMMKYIVGKIGPVAASINASPHTFQLYKSGVYDDKKCQHTKVNHAVLVVGYTEDTWILKNWWGNKWGENGYMRLKRGKNTCGILNYVAYALV